ncbi:MAG: DMT family transporter [Clostridia bacterium]|nr:DMT family transporter [Clostridia bacterium]
MKEDKSLIAYFAIVLKLLIYGSSSLFTRGLLSNTDVLDVISLRFLLSAIIFLFLNIFGVIRLDLRSKDYKSLLLCSIFEPVLYFVFETLGISMSSTIVVAVIMALSPISATVVSVIFLKEKIATIQTCCLLLGISGVLIIVTFTNRGADSSGATLLGILFMLLAVISDSMYAAFSRKSSKQFGPLEISCFSAFLGCIVFNSANVTRHIFTGTIHTYFKPLLLPQNLVGFVFLSVLSSIVAVSLGNFALSRLQIYIQWRC